MKTNIVGIAAAVLGLLAEGTMAGTIVYSYDEQHRLTGARYNNEATITYRYDKADNLTDFFIITDPAYQRSFLFYLSWMDMPVRPLCFRPDFDLDQMKKSSTDTEADHG